MQIRLLTADDASAFFELRREALEAEPEAFGSSPDEHRATGVEGVAARLHANSADRFVMGAFAEGELVATAGFFREPGAKERHKGRIWGVYVTRRMRGKGAGRGVLTAVLEQAADCRGIEQVLLVVNSQSVARRLYESLGFRSYGCERRALKIGERYVDEEHMVRDMTVPQQEGT